MADATADEEVEEKPKPGLMKPLIFGVVGALVAGGGGFFVTYSGIAQGLMGSGKAEAPKPVDRSTVFLPLDPLTVSLGSRANARVLRFRAELEVGTDYREEVDGLRPRIFDVLNTFLRAVDESELEDPTAMTRLRAQMLRRIQVVTGEGRVKDLLIIEFVLS